MPSIESESTLSKCYDLLDINLLSAAEKHRTINWMPGLRRADLNSNLAFGVKLTLGTTCRHS